MERKIHSPQGEFLQPSPIGLRFHHLESFVMLRKTYENPRLKFGTSISFDDLYKSPEYADTLVDYVGRRQKESLMECLNMQADEWEYNMSQEEALEYAEDQVGKDGVQMDEYLESTRAIYKTFLAADPSTKVQLTYEPDSMCFACLGNGEGQPGKHCLQPTPPGSKNKDFAFFKAVNAVRTHTGISEEVRDDIEITNKDSFQISIGTLRSAEFVESVWNYYYEFMKPGAWI